MRFDTYFSFLFAGILGLSVAETAGCKGGLDSNGQVDAAIDSGNITDAASPHYACQHGSGAGTVSNRGGSLVLNSAFVLSDPLPSAEPATSNRIRYLGLFKSFTMACGANCALPASSSPDRVSWITGRLPDELTMGAVLDLRTQDLSAGSIQNGQFLPELLNGLSSGRISIDGQGPTGEISGSFDYSLVLKNQTYSGTFSFSAVPCFAGPPIPPPSCQAVGGSCSAPGDCCPSLSCAGHRCCAASGDSAPGDATTCCSGMGYQSGSSGICCSPPGSSCSFDQECCGTPTSHGFCNLHTCG